MAAQRSAPGQALKRDSASDKHELKLKEFKPQTEIFNETSSSPGSNARNQIQYMTGLRFWLIISSLAISLFLTNLEIPIVTTSLVSITNDFGQFEDTGWVIFSYLLGYVGVLVIFAKLSDIFGRKLLLCTAISIFIIFSAACGGSQSLKQLIILRAFQGIGGAGCYALSTTIVSELVPPEKLAQYVANLSCVYAISLLLGPIIGGAINSRSTWRWAFLLNVPAAAPALLFAITAIPRGFPYHNSIDSPRRTLLPSGKHALERLDIPGDSLLLLATLSLTAAFQEADSKFPWKSGYVISLIIVAGFLWIALVSWERHVTIKAEVEEPVLPWRFLEDRVIVSVLLNAIFLGGPWFVAIFQLPQRFQVVHGSSGLRAGIQTMPFTFAAPVGSVISSLLASKLRTPAIFIVLTSAIIQTIGFALLASLPDSLHIPARMYVFQIIAGFGCGINISTLILIVPFVVELRDKAVGLSLVTQLRIMGGAVVLAIATSAFNSYTRPRLVEYLGSSHNSNDLLDSAQAIQRLSTTDQLHVKIILAHGYDLQMIVLAAFAAAQIPTTFLMW